MHQKRHRVEPIGFRVVGVFKVAGALILLTAGLGIFRLLHGSLGPELEDYATRLHLDPENRLVHGAIARVSSLDPTRLRQIGVGTFCFAALEAVEGVGLILRRRWAGYLTVIATALLLPVEAYELFHKVNAVRVAVLVTNLAILVYLVLKLLQERRAERGPTSKPRDRSHAVPGPQD